MSTARRRPPRGLESATTTTAGRPRASREAARGTAVALLLLAGGLAGCAGHHHLAEYDFAGRTLAVTYFPAPAPQLLTGRIPVDAQDPVGTLVRAGAGIAQEVEGRRARARLDSAATRLDLSAHMADRTLERAAVYLGARPVKERSDGEFLLEVDLRSYGIDARREPASLFVDAEVVLLDAATGREIWDEDVRTRDALGPGLESGGVLPPEAVTAGALSTLSVDDYERLLGRLADYAADAITRRLRTKLRDVRD